MTVDDEMQPAEQAREPRASPEGGRGAVAAVGLPARLHRRVGWTAGRRGGAVLFVAVAAAHAAGTAVVYQFNSLTSAGEVFFPAAGVTIGALLLVARRWWWIVLTATFASELAADLILGEGAATAVGSALANTVEPALGAALVLRVVSGRVQLSRRKDLLAYVVAGAIAGPVAGALIGTTATRFTEPYGAFPAVFARWWTGDALGVLIVGSLLLAWLTTDAGRAWSGAAVFEGSALAVLTVLVSWLAFWRWSPALAYLALVPLGWAAIRFGTRGATAAGAVIAVIAEWATVTGHGLFAVISGHRHGEALWFLQLFLAVAIVGGLMMASAVAEVGRAEAALRVSVGAEQEARQAARDAQAAERNRLARELHDSVSQALFSMTMHARTAQLAMAQAGLEEESPAARSVDRLRVLTSGALAEMRALIFELRPGALAEAGLVSALRRQAAAVSAREAVQISVHGPDNRLGLSPVAEEHCYRLILEAWHNTVKHATAERITTTVQGSDAGITIEVTDDGRGFEPSAVEPGHLGLHTMLERATAVGAAFEVASSPGRGTTIRLQLRGSQSFAEASAIGSNEPREGGPSE